MREAMEVAITVEETLHEDGLGFALSRAQLYSVTDDIYGVSVELRSEHGDIYSLLESDESAKIAEVSDFIAVISGGWASPISTDQDENSVVPSQHPERRRVRLLVLANRHGVASVLRFSDSPDEIVSDDGKATGALNDAVRKLFFRANALSN